jgi:hypothetical protein
MLVKIRASGKPAWPQKCALCLGAATEEDTITLPNEKIPYCASCYTRIGRLRNWKDNLFGVSLLIGALFGIISLIGLVGQEGWLAFLQKETYLLAVGGGLLFMGVAYGLMWVLMLPLRLVFHAQLSAPAVRESKSKEQHSRRLRFNNAEYAKHFQELNANMLID